MPLRFVRNDITKMKVDAIVLPANKFLKVGDGSSRAIYEAAGEIKLANELRLKYPEGCKMGHAVITLGYRLPARHVIHAVCPQWLGGENGEEEFLYSAYRESLILAEKNKCGSIAFPLLSTGSNRYPRKEAIKVAVRAILDFLSEDEMDVYLVFYGNSGIRDGVRFFGDIESFIDDVYDTTQTTARQRRPRGERGSNRSRGTMMQDWYGLREDFEAKLKEPNAKTNSYDITAEKRESFRDMLFRLIEESGMSDPQVYHAAGISKQNFNKIKQKKNYLPKKKTILALGIALKLSSRTMRELLVKAGYALSDCDDFDRIMRYCFDSRMLKFKDINQLLAAYGLKDEAFPYEKEEGEEEDDEDE